MLLFLTLFVSCVSTKVSSLANPKINISEYKKILVTCNTEDKEFRKAMEKELVKEFSDNGKIAVSSLDLISPFVEMSKSELKQLYLDYDIDCILNVSVISSSNETVYVPEETRTTYTNLYYYDDYYYYPYTSSSSTVTVTGGYSITYPTAKLEIILFDVDSGETALKITANAECDEDSDAETIAESLSEKIVQEYLKQK
jgi:hypothetical protein